MRAWKELTATALEGTSKSASGDEAERRLLSEASWHTLRRLAGGKADQIGGGGSALAPEETRPLVSRAAATRLEEILRSDERGHLGEWLDIAAAAGKRVPPSLLPPSSKTPPPTPASGRACWEPAARAFLGSRTRTKSGRSRTSPTPSKRFRPVFVRRG